MGANNQLTLPRTEELPRLTDRNSGAIDCKRCGKVVYKTMLIDKKPYCGGCFLNLEYPGKKPEELPSDVYNEIFG